MANAEYIQPEPRQALLLVVPPTYPQGREPDYNPKPPHSLEYLSAAVKATGIDRVGILDFDVTGTSAEQATEVIFQNQPEVLGVTVMQRALPSVKLIHEGLRRHGFDNPIIYGGIGATLCHREILTEIGDLKTAVFLGEAEEILPAYLHLWQAQANWRNLPAAAFINPEREEIRVNAIQPPPDITCLPPPDRQNYDYYYQKSGYGTFMTSRGCPWSQCTFCSNAAFERLHNDKVWRPRDTGEAVEELIGIHKEYGTKKYKTNDPNLFGPAPDGTAHVVNLCHQMTAAKERGLLPDDLSLMSFIRAEDVAGQPELLALMKKAGWDRLLVGVESSSDEILLREGSFNKGEASGVITKAIKDIRAAGMSVIAGFMIFNPYSTTETVAHDLQYLEANNLVVTLSKSLRVFNGVPMQRLLEQEGRLEKHSPFETYHEYQVPPEVAGLYYLLKNLHVLIEDPIRQISQSKIWELKARGNGFNQRVEWADFTQLTWQMESGLLHAGLDYFSENHDGRVITKAAEQLYDGPLAEQLRRLELTDTTGDQVIAQRGFVEASLEALNNRDQVTLHEEYVWNKD